MKAFISGGAGFIGSHLLARLLRQKESERVVVFDNFTSGRHSYLAPFRDDPRLVITQGDLKDLAAVTEAVRGCDSVFHFAANPDIARAATEPQIDFWEGTYLTQNLLEAMRMTGTQKMFYSSGSGVYGDKGETAFTEEYGPCTPISTYGASKLACEGLISAYCHMFAFSARAFRFANVVGPRQTHGVGYDFIHRLHKDHTCLRILGDGSQSKSYIHVDDVIDAFMLAAGSNPSGFDLYNVATDDYLTVNQIADITLQELGLDPKRVRRDYTGGNRGWKGDVPVVRFDVRKIKALGWGAKRTSAEAIRDSIRALRDEVQNDN